MRVVVDSAGQEEGRHPAGAEAGAAETPFALLGEEDVITGDAAFDAAVRVGGGRPSRSPSSSPEARQAYLAARERPAVRVERGRVTPRVLPPGGPGRRGASALAERSTGAGARRETRAPRERARGRARAPRGRGPAARGAAARLRGPRRGSRGARGWSRAPPAGSSHDPHPELRLRAAMALGAEGFEHLARSCAPRRRRSRRRRRQKLWWEISLPDGGDAPDEALLETAAAQKQRRPARCATSCDHRASPALLLPLVRGRCLGTGRCSSRRSTPSARSATPRSNRGARGAALSDPRGPPRRREGARGDRDGRGDPGLHALAESNANDASCAQPSPSLILMIQARLPGAAHGQVALATAVTPAAG